MKNHFIPFISILILLNGCDSKETNQQSGTNTTPPFTVKCKNSALPEFTLGYDSNPSQKEVDALCSCLWDKLVGWEKDTVIKLTSGKQDDISSLNMAAFPGSFGKRINECGGDKL